MSHTPQTIPDFLVRSFTLYRKKTAFIYKAEKREVFISYERFFDDVLTLTRAFEKRGIQKGEKVAFVSDNRYAWIVTDMALLALGAVSVPRGSDTRNVWCGRRRLFRS